MAANKDYYIKVYRPGTSGAFVGTITAFDFTSFRKQINGGLGELVFTIPNAFDNFRENDLVAFNNQVKMYCADIDSGPDGTLVYSGWIYSWEEDVTNSVETVTVHCYGNSTKLARSMLKSGSSVILNTSASGFQATGVPAATNVETVFKQVFDRYQAEASNPIANYTAASVGTTGQTLAYQFDKKMLSDALEVCRQAAPSGWYWYVDQTNAAFFQPKPSSARHTFILGKDFAAINVFKNSDKIVNNVLFQSSSGAQSILKRYQDSTSQGNYDDRWAVVTDSSILDSTTADNVGNQYLASNKDPKTRTKVTILDNNVGGGAGYNVEIISPGDTCNFRGFNDITSRTFFDNMQIVSVEYYGHSVILELEELSDSIARQAYQANKTANLALGSNSLGSYNSVSVSPLVGQLLMFAGSAAPSGFLLCNGQAVSRTTYANLFTVVGSAFGAGDGSTTFNVPNFSDRMPLGVGGNALGAAGGSSTINISHSHTVNGHSHTVNNHSHESFHTGNNQGDWYTNAGQQIMAGDQASPGTGRANSNTGSGYPNANSTYYTGGSSPGTDSQSPGTNSQLSSSQSVLNPFLAINFVIRY
jgi:microcystin-dependent protein